MYLQRNGTTWSDGTLEMFTGEDDIENLGKIVSWDGSETTDAFEGECGKVRGSADGLFPPGIAAVSDTISMFSTDLCRPLHFSKSGEQALHGIPVTTFDLMASNFANSTVCSDNQCYQNNVPNGVQVNCNLQSSFKSEYFFRMQKLFYAGLLDASTNMSRPLHQVRCLFG